MTDVPVALGEKPRPSSPPLPTDRPPTAPEYFHVLPKPTGPICNLDGEYCFFLSKEALYPDDRFRTQDQGLSPPRTDLQLDLWRLRPSADGDQ